MNDRSSSNQGGRRGFEPGGLDASWSVLHACILAGRYDQACGLITQILDTSLRGSKEVISLLRVAVEICQACKQSHREVDWYQRTWQVASQREKSLRQELTSLLEILIDSEELSTAESEVDSDPGAEGELMLKPDDHPDYAPKLGIFRRLRDKLVLKPYLAFDPRLPSQDQSLARRVEEIDSDPSPLPDKFTQEKESESFSAPQIIKVLSPAKLVVYCLGAFRVYQDDQPVAEWSSGKSKAIFKYLITHRQVPVVKDVLMDLFWPDVPPEAARNNLNVAIFGLRQTLRKTHNHFSHILFTNDAYQLNPDLSIWLDCEAFKDCITSAIRAEQEQKLSLALRYFCAAEELYQGEYFAEDRYEDWPIVHRQRFQDEYLSLLERLGNLYFEQANYPACISACRKILDLDSCRELAHRQLMRCYTQLGQPYLALRQFHLCVEALKNDLDLDPSTDTKQLYLQLRRQE